MPPRPPRFGLDDIPPLPELLGGNKDLPLKIGGSFTLVLRYGTSEEDKETLIRERNESLKEPGRPLPQDQRKIGKGLVCIDATCRGQ